MAATVEKENKVTVAQFFQGLGVDPLKFAVVNFATTGVNNHDQILELVVAHPIKAGVETRQWFVVGGDPTVNNEWTRIEERDYTAGAKPFAEVMAEAKAYGEKLKPEYYVLNDWRWNERWFSNGKIKFWWCAPGVATLAGSNSFCLLDYDSVRSSGDTLAGYEKFDVMCNDFGSRVKTGRAGRKRKLEDVLSSRKVDLGETGTVAERKSIAMVCLMRELLEEPAFEVVSL